MEEVTALIQSWSSRSNDGDASSHLSTLLLEWTGLVLLDAFGTMTACDNSDIPHPDILKNTVEIGVGLFTAGAIVLGSAIIVHAVMFAVSVVLTQMYRRKRLLGDDSPS